MVDTMLTLVKPAAREQDAFGVWRTTAPVEREVFARMDDVSRNEFFSGGQAGMRPELRFRIAPVEYEGEIVCIHAGTRYAVYRTYHDPGTDELELYVQREVGVHGAQTGT